MTIKALQSTLLAALFFFVATPAFAVGNPQSFGAHPNVTAQRGASDDQPASASGTARACLAREGAIQTRSTHLVDLVTNMERVFDDIVTRVENYYTSTVVPSGKTVANYATLVANIQTKKTAIATTLAKAQADVSNFSCTTSDPKTQMTQFRVDMQAVKRALKEYRTSIKNLIVAIHTVTGTESSESPKPTPTPSPSPSSTPTK